MSVWRLGINGYRTRHRKGLLSCPARVFLWISQATPSRWQVLPHEQHILCVAFAYLSSGKRDCRSTEFRHYHVREHFLDRYKHQICLLRPASSRLLTNFLLTLPLLEVLQGAFRSIFRRLTYQSLTAGINNANIQWPIYSNILAQIQRCSLDKLSCL